MKQCHFCKRFYLPEDVAEVKIESFPEVEKSVFICYMCESLVKRGVPVAVE